MHNEHQGNAMAEIALALAMAFFSIMVLTMVSMGAGPGEAAAPVEVSRNGLAVRPSTPTSEKGSELTREKPVSDGFIIIYHRGHFRDAELRAIEPAEAAKERKIILAVDPSLSMTEAMAARGQVPHRDVIVTTLDDRWLKVLKEM